MSDYIATDPDDFLDWLNGGDREQITRTFYDQVYDVAFDIPYDQLFLRNRVASVMYLDEETIFTTDYDNWILNGVYEDDQYKSAIHYSYDIHGNVDLVVYDVPYLKRFNRRYYSTEYTYDLLSGNVHKVMYQQSKPDEFYHRYQYDPDNRIVSAQTSRNNLIWTEDAHYFYYPHGPLLRTELGENKVQGVDYAYTMQGWLKGVNSSTMMYNRDMGHDGYASLPNNPNAGVARDAYGFTLDYYFDSDFKDYQSIYSGNQNFINFEADRASSDMDYSTRSLFNGNISYMITALPNVASLPNSSVVPDPLVNFYSYDKLNRIVASTKAAADYSSNEWGNLIADHYDTYYTYDANGNLLTLLRNNHSNDPEMDDFDYSYESVIDPYSYYSGQTINRLASVDDGIGATDVDFDFEGTSNYDYDDIGNLISDSGEEIEEIEWNTYGKVTKVTRTSESLKADLEFWYDPMGNRLCKIVKPRDENADPTTQEEWVIYWYMRDAQGNVMAVYAENYNADEELAELKVKEWNIYGSSRHGILNATPEEDMLAQLDYGTISYLSGGWIDPSDTSLYWQRSVPTWESFDHIAGFRNYELTNHLGNVMAVVTDRAIPIQDGQTPTLIEYKLPDYRAVTDYYPFGMILPERSWNLPDSSNIFVSLFFDNVLDLDFENENGTWTVPNRNAGISFSSGNMYLTGYQDSGAAYTDFSTETDSTYVITMNFSGVTGLATWNVSARDDQNNVLASTSITSLSTSPLTLEFEAASTTSRLYISRTSGSGTIVLTIEDISIDGKYHKKDTLFLSYRYGFNSQERDDEIYGKGNSYTAEYWQYDARLGRRWNMDPVVKPHESPYATFANNAIWFVDPSGADTIVDPNGDSYNVGTGYSQSNDQQVLYGERLTIKVWDANAQGVNSDKSGSYVNYDHEKHSQLIAKSTSLSGVLALNIYGFDKVILEGGLLNDFKNDNNLLGIEKKLLDKVRANPLYGEKDFKIKESYKPFCFGGLSSPAPMWIQALSLTDIHISMMLFPETWSAATQRTTWVVRNVDLYSEVSVSANGTITIRYSFDDQLDLRPNGSNKTYDAATTGLGFIYHDVYGITDKMRVMGSWTKTYKPK